MSPTPTPEEAADALEEFLEEYMLKHKEYWKKKVGDRMRDRMLYVQYVEGSGDEVTAAFAVRSEELSGPDLDPKADPELPRLAQKALDAARQALPDLQQYRFNYQFL